MPKQLCITSAAHKSSKPLTLPLNDSFFQKLFFLGCSYYFDFHKKMLIGIYVSLFISVVRTDILEILLPSVIHEHDTYALEKEITFPHLLKVFLSTIFSNIQYIEIFILC